MYKFQQQNLVGQEGEKNLDEWLESKYSVIDVSHVPQYQVANIDRLIMGRNGSAIAVEYKFDKTAARTGNLFFETVSVDNCNKPGWGWSSQASFFIFLIPKQNVFIIEPGKLRNLVWQHRFSLDEKHIPNRGYKTIGYPIRLEYVKTVAYSVTTLSDSPPDLY